MRSGWDADAYWAYMDASPLGTAHWHEDKLNIQLFALGHELLTEAGIFLYDTSEMRRYSISTRSHNTIRVDGCDQASGGMHPWKPEMIREKVELLWQTEESRDTAEASYTDGYGPGHIPVIHTRRLIFLKNEVSLPPLFLVIDRLTARDDVPHSYEILWHLCDNPVSLRHRTAESAYPDGVGLTVSSSGGGMSVVRGQKTPVWQGWAPNFAPGDVEHFPIPTVVNTGVFMLGCLVFFVDTITAWGEAAGFANVGAYMIFGLTGINFLIELGVNLVLAPVITRLIRVGKK